MSTVTLNYGNLSDEQIYIDILKNLGTLFPKTDLVLSVISNFTAVLKQSFGKISWVGFYFLNGDYLHLGPFQGKIACTQIRVGNGVCGTSAVERKTIIVENVNKFPGHIACDSDSKSEIVVPIIYNDNLIGVLDIDSYRYSAFTEIDKHYLEQMVDFLAPRINNIL
ncbi:MAG: GAF domain-containing protein [Ignavibacteriales bacterium]